MSEKPVGPAVIGLMRPTILLPVALIENKTKPEIEPLVAHELIHVRRGDLWWAVLQTLATCLFWFHPFVWIASRMLTRESERSCDEETIAGLDCRPADYARGLLDVLERKHQLRVAPALPGVRPMEVTSARLERVMRMGNGIQKRTPLWVWLVMLFCGAVVLPGAAWAVVQEEAAAKTQDEVGDPAALPASSASTKPNQDGQYQEHRFEVGDLLKKIRADNVFKHSAESILIGALSPFDPPADQTEQIVVGNPFTPLRGARISGNQLVADETPRRIKLIQEAIDNYRANGFCQVVVKRVFSISIKTRLVGLELTGSKLNQMLPPALFRRLISTQPANRPNLTFPHWNFPNATVFMRCLTLTEVLRCCFHRFPRWNCKRIIKMAASQKRHILSCITPTSRCSMDGLRKLLPVSNCLSSLQSRKCWPPKVKAKPINQLFRFFDTGTRIRIRPVVKEDTIDVECHVQLKEVSDVKVLHLAQWQEDSKPVSQKFDKTEREQIAKSHAKDGGEKVVPPTETLVGGELREFQSNRPR